MSEGNQTEDLQNKQPAVCSLGEMDSPTKRYNEFTELIGQAEASMRDKLSELTLPEGDINNLSTEKSSEGVTHKDYVTVDNTKCIAQQSAESPATEQEKFPVNTSQLTGNVTGEKDIQGTVPFQFSARDLGISGDEAGTRITSDKQFGTDEIISSNKQNTLADIRNEESGTGDITIQCEQSGMINIISKCDLTVTGDVTSQQNGAAAIIGEQSSNNYLTDDIGESQAGTDALSGTETGTNEIFARDVVTASVTSERENVQSKEGTPTEEQENVQSKEGTPTEEHRDIEESGAEVRHIDTSDSNTPLDSQTVSDDRNMDDSEKDSNIVKDKYTETETANIPNNEFVAITCSGSNGESSSVEKASGNESGSVIESNGQMVETIEKTSDTDLHTYYNESDNEKRNVKDTVNDERRAEQITSMRNSAGNELKLAGTESMAEEGFIITDVRSLTEESVNVAFSQSSEDVSLQNGSYQTAGADNQESEAVASTGHLIQESDNEALEPSQPSKKRRKSPNTVRRIIEKTSEEDIIDDRAAEEQPTANIVPLSSGLDETPDQLNERSGTDSENRSEADGELATSGTISVPVSSEASSPVATELESLPVISNTFSIPDISSSVPVIKQERPDDGMYGVVKNSENSSQAIQTVTVATSQPPAINPVAGNTPVHKGRIVNQVRPVANAQKVVMSRLPHIIYPPKVSNVSSSPASLTRYQVSVAQPKSVNRVQTVPHTRIINGGTAAPVVVRTLLPKSAATAGQTQTATKTMSSSSQDQGKDKMKETGLNSRKLSTINIHTVGVARITDLIARKNPLPTYKPAPAPPHLEGYRKNQVFPCYECGDSFYMEKSLRHHLGRCSMKIYYKCEKCHKTIMFRNKCQLLNHLRSHLNIKKTQAVPIHIKSDSIEIETNFNDIGPDKQFEWYKDEPNPAGQKVPCLGCSKEFENLEELANHVKGDNSEHFFCNECPLYLDTKCGLLAHQKLHQMCELKRNKRLSSEDWKLLKGLSCPECGKHFWKGLGSGNLGNYFDEITRHMKNECFHLSRLPAFKCTKCNKVFQSFEGMRNHLNTCLEHYYKCGMCPMALKSLKSLDTHNSQKHKTVENSEEPAGMKAKIIYRCHVCDTLIDDRVFLVQHIEKHLEEFKKLPQTHYHCLQCGQLFISKEELVQHSSNHTAVRWQYYCTFCSADKVKPVLYIAHVLKNHTSTKSNLASNSVVRFCNYCGLVCIGEHMIQKHACLGMRNARFVVGDKSARMETKDKTRVNETKGIIMEIRNDIPSILSRLCMSCSVPFRSQSHRLNHLKEHRDLDKIFICKLCDCMNFKSIHELRSHEIACSEMNKMPNVSTQSAQHSSKSKKLKSTGENTESSFTDGVELTTKGQAGSSKQKKDVVEVYMCDKCEATFTRKSKQEEHMKSEHGFHPCHLCGVIHESQSSLKKHLMMDHEGKRMLFYCAICRSRKNDRAFTVKEKLEKHFRLKHRMKVIDESKIITELPGLPEQSKETSPVAQKRKSSEAMASESSVKKLRIEGESDFKCAKCLFTCDDKAEFREHILEHKAADTYQCFECGLCFAVLPSLKKHLFMVHKVRDFKSYMEENKIKEPKELEDFDDEIKREPDQETEEPMEESSEEEESRNPLECNVCYRSFDSEKAIKSHMRTHGMAFIKKSRRRAQASSPGKKTRNDKLNITTNEEGKKEGLILKIKMNRGEPARTVSEQVKRNSDLGLVDKDTKSSVNVKLSDAEIENERSANITDDAETLEEERVTS